MATPSVDIFENDIRQSLIKAEQPGMECEGHRGEAGRNNDLMLKGERHFEKETEEENKLSSPRA
jgi:HSP20 family molecular chaperone IbpA